MAPDRTTTTSPTDQVLWKVMSTMGAWETPARGPNGKHSLIVPGEPSDWLASGTTDRRQVKPATVPPRFSQAARQLRLLNTLARDDALAVDVMSYMAIYGPMTARRLAYLTDRPPDVVMTILADLLEVAIVRADGDHFVLTDLGQHIVTRIEATEDAQDLALISQLAGE